MSILCRTHAYTRADYAPRSATAWGDPLCILQPSSTADVQKAISYLSSRRVRFAIRSGGHLPSPLGANTNDGVLIDTSLLNTREYNKENQNVKIGTGLRWGDVYSYLDQYRVTVVGGRVLDVGVGGLILGSGLSYLSDLHGMACDNVVNFEVSPHTVLGGTVSHCSRWSWQMALS
jgi:FAD/FMN-containing dehydrogenase